jgi:hypothetical protein
VTTVPPEARRDRPAETVAGFLAALSLFGGLIAIVERPVRIGLFAMFLGLVAVGMGGRHQRLAAAAVAVATASWFAGMIVCISTGRPLW